MLDWLTDIDTALFFFINHTLHSELLDAALPWYRERLIWAPLYLFIIAFAAQNLSRRQAFQLLLGLALAFGSADAASNYLFKKNVQRLRPCNDPAIQTKVELRLPKCGTGYSFTSSHAANHFAVALYLAMAFGHIRKWIKPTLIAWAASIAFAQVYVGVHYPFDVICGALLGWFCSKIGYWFYLLLHNTPLPS